ncbi:hypothetical protein [Catenuloplanes indicus]|uniref:Uncharacterized protein n=1 Tax=Catenuloplanes indicus TaxID=137267 RepID=A0AAE3WAQ0_9ACTN|nr:hypothetical protein [Catenuloplanes indicus]MDQ0371632.1 hypothetical protein [Catenuloplanes indicus]
MTGRVFEAICEGGPLHGRVQLSRFPGGFVLGDKPRHMVWIYRWDGHARVWRVDPGGHAGDNRWLSEAAAIAAAESDLFDVICLPEAGEV